MRKYHQRLFRVARAITGDSSEAEDAVQAAYLLAYVRVSQFAGRSTVGTWLTRIAINEARARRRARRGRQATDSLDAVADSVSDAHDSPEDEVSLQQQARLIESAIDSLPEPYRLVLLRRQVQGMSSEQAAASLGVSEEVVRVRLHRARLMLQKLVTGSYRFPLHPRPPTPSHSGEATQVHRTGRGASPHGNP
jgi:RNA polymerase sigma-70 factor, ECF subfamily